MANELGQAQTTVGHLTVRYKGPPDDINRTALRLRMEHLLGTVDLRPAGLPSGAILVVRKLEEPAPLSTPALLQPSQSAWAERLRNQIATLYSAAARPALSPHTVNTTSVLFADAGELLACLTRAMLSGQALHQWYWQQLLRSVPGYSQGLLHSSSTLAALWCEHATFLPVALASLSTAEARAGVALFSSSELSKVTHSLHADFDLPSKVLTVQMPDTSMSESSPDPSFATEQSGQAAITPPWQQWLPVTIHSALKPQAHYLLGLGLALYYAPAFARSTTFANQAASWLRAELSARQAGRNDVNSQLAPERVDIELTTQTTSPQSLELATQQAGTDRAMSQAKQEKASTRFPTHQPSWQRVESTAGDAGSEGVDSEAPLDASAPQYLQFPENAFSISAPTGGDARTPPSPQEVFMSEAQPLPLDGSPTELGGILYLVHVLTWLNLPGAWSGEGTLAKHLSGWAIVEAVARGLLGVLDGRFIDDPIWNIFALLDGREPGTPAGAGLPQQTSFRLPVQWLHRYGLAEPTWLAVRHEAHVLLFDKTAGYLVCDVPLLERSPDEVIATEIAAYKEQGMTADWYFGESLPPASLDAGLSTFLSENTIWWLERVLGFVRYLLARVLGESAPGTNNLAEIMLCKHGQLSAGRTHIDLHMSLEQISIAIRRAGLDRDPGWIPDLGRIVLFHFD